MWKNKHVLIALVIAPVLAVIAYIGVDAVVSEQPHVAQKGAVYPLRVLSSCRYASGKCELRNGDIRVVLSLASDASWRLDSEVALRGALISHSNDDSPRRFTEVAGDPKHWQVSAQPQRSGSEDSLRLVIAVGDSQYFAEVPVSFAWGER